LRELTFAFGSVLIQLELNLCIYNYFNAIACHFNSYYVLHLHSHTHSHKLIHATANSVAKTYTNILLARRVVNMFKITIFVFTIYLSKLLFSCFS